MDFGCGAGAFARHLRQQGLHIRYIGVDVTAAQLDLARQGADSADQFLLANFLDPDVTLPNADFVIANGVLNVGYVSPTLALSLLLDRMLACARRGAALTLISSYAPKRLPHLTYFDPLQSLGAALAKTSRVKLDHSYLPHDFALFAYPEAGSPGGSQ